MSAKKSNGSEKKMDKDTGAGVPGLKINPDNPKDDDITENPCDEAGGKTPAEEAGRNAGSPGGTIGNDGKPILGDDDVLTFPGEAKKKKPKRVAPSPEPAPELTDYDILLNMLEETFIAATGRPLNDDTVCNHRNNTVFQATQRFLVDHDRLKHVLLAQD